MIYVTKTKEQREKKDVCPFLLLENSRSPSPLQEPQPPPSFSGTLDLSNCLGIDSLTSSGVAESMAISCLTSFFNIYLFIYGAASGVGCHTRDLPCRLSGCGAWTQLLRHTGLAALRHVRSQSQTRDRTCVPCIARQILNRWSTREVPPHLTFRGNSRLFSKGSS